MPRIVGTFRPVACGLEQGVNSLTEQGLQIGLRERSALQAILGLLKKSLCLEQGSCAMDTIEIRGKKFPVDPVVIRESSKEREADGHYCREYESGKSIA